MRETPSQVRGKAIPHEVQLAAGAMLFRLSLEASRMQVLFEFRRVANERYCLVNLYCKN